MKYNTQSHPFHLVEPSPWPLTTSIGLGIMAMGGVIFFSGLGSLVLIIGFVVTIMTSTLWWRDCIREGKLNVPFFLNLTICREISLVVSHYKIMGQSAGNLVNYARLRAILRENLRDYRLNIVSSAQIKHDIDNSNNVAKFKEFYTDDSIGAYLAGLIEGDGYIEIQSDKSKAKKINPRIVFTFHKNNLVLFEQINAFIGSGFFKKSSINVMRFVVADKQGVIKLTNLTNGYFRTPKIKTLTNRQIKCS